MASEEIKYWSWRLEWIVRALAQKASVQMELFPDFTCVADELALEFEECVNASRSAEQFGPGLVAKALIELNNELESMSGSEQAHLWTDEALAQSPEWERVRLCATELAKAAGWSIDSPGSSLQIYVGPQA